MLQELLSIDVDRPLGTYTHIVGSLHLYERHFQFAREILRNQDEREFEMPPMEERDELPRFLGAEAQVRSDLPAEDQLHPYWSNLLAVLKSYRLFKATASSGQALASIPSGSRYTTLLENLWRSDVLEREHSGG
jgi:thymidylate synthase